MYKIAKPIFLIAETAVHPGSGSDLGYIDNPIQREVHTGYPKIEGSSLKGALRQAFEARIGNPDFSKKVDFNDETIKIHRVFGLDDDGYSKEKEYPKNEKDKNKKKSEKDLLHELFKDNKDFAGAIAFTDARILLFPVKSLKGTFAWITCPRVLAKFKQELKLVNELANIHKNNNLFKIKKEDGTEISIENIQFSVSEKVLTTTNSNLLIGNNKIQLNEYLYDVKKDENANRLAQWLKKKVFQNQGIDIADIEKNLVIVSDDDFAYFVKYSTEVATRIKIDNETGTVKEGALFTVEYLPSETVMYSLVMFAPEFRKNGMDDKKMDEKKVEKFFDDHKPSYFQLGGDATLGKGIFRLTVLNSKN